MSSCEHQCQNTISENVLTMTKRITKLQSPIRNMLPFLLASLIILKLWQVLNAGVKANEITIRKRNIDISVL